MKRVLLKWMALVLLIGLSACNTPKPKLINQIIQMPKDSHIYTAYNLWYHDPLKMNSQNIHNGTILPSGTEVKDVLITENTIEFRVVNPESLALPRPVKKVKNGDGKDTYGLFRLEFDPVMRMETIERFLKRLFVTQDFAAQTKGFSSSAVTNIRQGSVVKGMTREEVLMAFGYPSPHRTPSLKDDTWIYWVETGVTKRVVFGKDKVIALIQL